MRDLPNWKWKTNLTTANKNSLQKQKYQWYYNEKRI